MLTAKRLAQLVDESVADEKSCRFVVYWHRVEGSRNQFAAQLRQTSLDSCVVDSVVLRTKGFDDPNSIAADLVALLNAHRKALEAGRWGGLSSGQRIVLVILSKASFDMPQISSPCRLPSWFPVHAGEEIEVTIRDTERSVTVPISTEEVRIQSLSAQLYGLEKAVVHRLSKCLQADKRIGDALWERIKSDKESQTIAKFVENAKAAQEKVSDATKFRPSAKAGDFFIGRVLRLMCKRSPDQVPDAAKALATALDLPEKRIAHEGMQSILSRPVNREDSEAHRTGRTLLITAYATSQLITAIYHADDYGLYPLYIVKAASYDLRCTLQELRNLLDSL